MIKSPKRYARQAAQERAESLQALTYRQGARLLEQLLRSRLSFELRFADDDHPRALKFGTLKLRRTRDDANP